MAAWTMSRSWGIVFTCLVLGLCIMNTVFYEWSVFMTDSGSLTSLVMFKLNELKQLPYISSHS